MGTSIEFDEMVRTCRNGLTAYARSVCRDRWTADEAVQETLIRAWRYFPTFRGDSSPMTWLVSICRRVVVDLARRSTRHDSLAEDFVDDIDAFAGGHLIDLVRSLPLPQREVIVLCGLLGFDYDTAADMIGVPVGTVRSRLSRARTALGE
ncbi:MAG: RNA polymerase sigma factor, partial [Acidimicrobiales bacterium]